MLRFVTRTAQSPHGNRLRDTFLVPPATEIGPGYFNEARFSLWLAR